MKKEILVITTHTHTHTHFLVGNYEGERNVIFILYLAPVLSKSSDVAILKNMLVISLLEEGPL